MDKQQIKEKIKELITRYEKLSDSEIRKYNEQQTKDHFIRPLFEALGWNFQDDVWSETDVHGKRVDYAFLIGGITKFFIEAKSLKTDLDLETHAKQAINYAWNKGVNWAVLTDFESVKVFNAMADSRNLLDKLVFEISHKDFISDFERLGMLSKESFQKNVLEEYAVKHGKKLKKLTVDEKLYNDLREARKELTEGFSVWNKGIDKEVLEEGVQRIIERLMFIRVLEDKELEDSVLIPILREWEKNKNIQLFSKLIVKFRELDDIYNSNLFEEHACEKWEEYSVKWDKIFPLLYGSSVYGYDFKVIPADILGGVYESYLSYIAQNPIEIDKKGKDGKLFEVESKKDIKVKSRKKRKEQGIYYTPKFIVDYIVKNTLGEKLKEAKSVNDLKQIKVLDPACGSGSFLTRALEAINDKYKDFGNPGNQYTKTEILMSNIYGVDLDPQAVEFAKLNLLIDALDKKAKLPDLTGNIRVGNSLISGNEDELKKYFGSNYRDKKPFNWEEEFSGVFALFNKGGAGGFDVIIGNPPWGANIDKDAEYLGEKYPNSTQKHKDIYKIFIDKAISLLKEDGMLGFIIPNTFLYQPRYEDIKEIINRYENYVINLGEKIFKNVQLPSCVLILKKKSGKNKFIIDLTKEERTNLPAKILTADPKSQIKAEKIIRGIIKNTGLTFDDAFLLKDAGVKHQRISIGKGEKGKNDLRERIYYHDQLKNSTDYPLFTGSDINRYTILSKPSFFLKNNYKKLLNKNEIVYFDKKMMNERRKVVWRQTADRIRAIIINDEWFANTLQAAVIKDEYKNKFSLEYALAIFNSGYIDYIYRQKVLETGKVFPQVKLKYLRDLPFVIGDKKQQAEISELSKKMIKLYKDLNAISEHSDKWNNVKREIEKTDKEIDKRVYELYGLTEEERKIIEEK